MCVARGRSAKSGVCGCMWLPPTTTELTSHSFLIKYLGGQATAYKTILMYFSYPPLYLGGEPSSVAWVPRGLYDDHEGGSEEVDEDGRIMEDDADERHEHSGHGQSGHGQSGHAYGHRGHEVRSDMCVAARRDGYSMSSLCLIKLPHSSIPNAEPSIIGTARVGGDVTSISVFPRGEEQKPFVIACTADGSASLHPLDAQHTGTAV
jgi:hypothetical protein